MQDSIIENSPTTEDLELQAMIHEVADGRNAEAPLLGRNSSAGLSTAHNDHEELDGRPSLISKVRGSGSWFIWALTCSAGISGLLFGYDTGVISSTLVSIGSDLSHRELTILDKSLITSSTSFFALIASPFAGLLGDRIGRKPIILIADVLFLLGSVWQAATFSVWGMIFGRSLVGLAIGAASLIAPLYISELSPSDLRGRLVTMLVLFITGGQVVAYIIGWLLSTSPAGWRWMVGLGALPAVIQLFILLFLPETPRWLVRADREGEARKIITKVYGQSAPAQTMERIVRDIRREILEEENEMDNQTPISVGGGNDTSTSARWRRQFLSAIPQRWTSLFKTACNRRALTLACMLQGLQQLCGFNSLMYFSATIFSLLSFSSPTLTSLSVAVTNFVFTLVAFSIIDRVGRRRILLASIPVMTFALLFCACAFSFLELPSSSSSTTTTTTTTQTDDDPSTPSSSLHLSALIILLSLTIYTASFATGLGSVPWQQSELFPLNVRSLGSSLSTATNWGANFIVGLTFLPLMEWISPSWTFVLYAVVCAVGWCGVWAVYPEMSGLELEDVRGLLDQGWGVKESLERFRSRKRDEA
ncbi:hypothetical protein AJ80_07928 [Polytolypa hystricis UAMH7299]|uniref:Major facilitator superfamily (MFS) profile domain-containing protein n=1 Tax=Polytolypa hystricis (strain UAMH7299) TaxID=1447883 RepID=A0A2B7XH09_POLH7|nr:hypothetical protein AJ80_07928 [Polytolypa hystricis UAMH7299]